MPRAIAINVAANTNLPGVRGPVYPDGTFVYVPIPERKPTLPVATVPTYADLDPPVELPSDAMDRPVHLDPEFATYPYCESYTYGDDHAVKAGPLSTLDPGDWLLFYATLDFHGEYDEADPYLPPDWGVYLIGAFEVAFAVTGEEYETLSTADRERFANNAHVKRDPFDAKVLVAGTPDSRLFDRVVPLSSPAAGADANELVTRLSNDSGRGPWWRRRLWFDEDATATVLDLLDSRAFGDFFESPARDRRT